MANWRDWDDLRFVVALADTGSIKRASKILGSSQATVSRKIHSANERFGQSIFKKHKDVWRLTTEGTPLYDLAKNFETSLSTLLHKYEDNKTPQSLLLTSLDFLIRSVLVPNFPLLLEKSPLIELTLHSSNANLSLAKGEADIAVRMARPTSGQLVIRKLGEFTYSIYGVEGGDHSNWIGRADHLDFVPEIVMAKQFFQKPPVIRVADYKASLEAMKSMRIATVLPDILADGAHGVIKVDNTPSVQREAWLIINEDRQNDEAIRAVIDWLEICFKAYNSRTDVGAF